MSKEEKSVFEVTEKKKKKKVIIITSVVVAVVIAMSVAWSIFKKVNTAQKIKTEADFIEFFEEGFSNRVNACEVTSYVLENDITITRTDLKNPIMKKYEQNISAGNKTEEEARKISSYEYTMIFDGKGHTIKNLSLTGYGASLFGVVDGNVTIKNVTFENLTINGKGSTGALISYLCENKTATFENVKIINSSIVCEENAPVGGLIGQSDEGRLRIKNCTIENSSVVAENATNVGGIAGRMFNYAYDISTIENCKNIDTTVKGNENVGGIVGEYYDKWHDTLGLGEGNGEDDYINFKGLENSGDITAKTKNAGGVMGHLGYYDNTYFSFVDCDNKSSDTGIVVSNGDNVGGILGSAHYTGDILYVTTGCGLKFNNCENIAEIKAENGNNAGGIVGYTAAYIFEHKYEDCENFGYVTAKSYVGGIAGYLEDDKLINQSFFTFKNCVNGNSLLGGYYVAGILGYSPNFFTFDTCTNDAGSTCEIIALGYVAGISGSHGTFRNCVNRTNILVGGTNTQNTAIECNYAGGIVAYGQDSAFANCSNFADINYTRTNEDTTINYVGGIAGGLASLSMVNCSNSGDIYGSNNVGGLAGDVNANLFDKRQYLTNCSNTGNIYALGQVNTTAEKYTNNNKDDINGKVGLLIGKFLTGARLIEFKNITVGGNLYIINDTDYVGGWCGYLEDSSASTLKSSIEESTIEYKIYFSQNVSEVCKTNFKYGEKVFENVVVGFNQPTALDNFQYTEEE